MVKELEKATYIELERRRHQILWELGKVEEELQARRKQDRKVTRAEEVEWIPSGELHSTRQSGMKLGRLVTPEMGFNVYTIRAFLAEVAPGAQEGAYHSHGEAIKYYLSGEAEEIIGDHRIKVKAGDCAFIPANVYHGTQNLGPEPTRYLAVVQYPGTSLQIPAYFKPREDLHVSD
ncbi:MAG TPA: cupin domain-containing protein [Dehalococcoidia bacterium]|nr:cupin domain-containing protein [Dehalococcoidia bacterium]